MNKDTKRRRLLEVQSGPNEQNNSISPPAIPSLSSTAASASHMRPVHVGIT